MPAEAVAWVDVEGAVRAFVRDEVASITRRAFFGVSDTATFPQIVVQRIAGADDAAVVQFDCWDATTADGGSKGRVAATTAELCAALDALARYQHDDVVLTGSSKPDVRWLPDFDSDQPRYIVTATLTACAAPAGS